MDEHFSMSIEELQESVSKLNRKERHHLAAFLVAIDDQEDKEYQLKLAQKIDDRDPANWVTLDELDRRLDLDES